jgi:hypothetical protein
VLQLMHTVSDWASSTDRVDALVVDVCTLISEH